MSQQPYYPPQGPQYPPQQYQQPPVQQGPPEWAQPQPQWTPPGQPIQQPYGQQLGQGQPPQQPLVNGGIDDFYSQPTVGGGPGISWKGKPDGYTVQGIVPRDVGDGDVQQEVGAPNTAQAGVPQFFRDGRPKFVMTVPLQVQPSQEFPDGEARLFVRGQLKDELTRAMAEAGEQGAPRGGSSITVTLVQRKQGRGSIPQNIFRVIYTPAGQQAPPIQQPAAQPVQQYAPAPAQQFQPQPAAQAWQGYPQQAPQATGAPSPAPVATSQPAPVAQQPVQQQVQQPQPPQGLSPEQQQLMAQLTGQQQAG